MGRELWCTAATGSLPWESTGGRAMEQLSERLMNWASILEEKTRAQAERTASMPFIFPHVALMPDAHLGLGATVGSVIPTVRGRGGCRYRLRDDRGAYPVHGRG